MDAVQLEAYLEREGLRHRVISADGLPAAAAALTARPFGLIVNTDPASGPGSHWVSFYLPEKGLPEFFDSVGRSPEDYHPEFEDFLIVHGPDYLRNSGRIQDYGSATCGAYCLDFLTQRDRGVDFGRYLAAWTCDYAENDRLLLRRLCCIQ